MGDSEHIVLHIGVAKCGSSSLQTQLSNEPEFAGEHGRHHVYCAVNGDGRLDVGHTLRPIAHRTITGYASSFDFVDRAGISRLQPAMAELARLVASGCTPILSSEGWFARGEIFRAGSPFSPHGLRAQALMFVRPPLEWLNSAFWQWGAWGGEPLSQWVHHMLPRLRWGACVERWLCVPGVSKVDVRLGTRDVVKQFYTALGAEYRPVPPVNTAVPPALLRFFQRHRRYRPGPHDAGLEFMLNRWVRWHGHNRAPWVLPRALQEEVMQLLRPDHERLLRHLSSDVRRAMLADARFWSPEPYADREVVSIEGDATRAQTDALIAALVETIGRLDQASRRPGGQHLRPAAAQVSAPKS